MKRISFIASIVVCLLLSTKLSAQTGRDVAQKVKDRPDGDTRQSEMTMKLINKRGSVRERKLKSYSIDVGKGKKDRKTMMFFLYPGDVKGTGFLTWDYDKIDKEDDKWLYLPAMKKTRRISGSSAKKDYFMGSDFTYDDMGSRNVDEDTHKLLGEEDLGGHRCWKLESTPKDGRDVYSKKIAWIRQDCLIPITVEYYDKMGKLHRRLELSEIRKVDGVWTAQKMEMSNVQTGHKTVLELRNVQFDRPLDESKFSVSVLEKGSLQ
ncbi:MAG: outer membrane lipoprotein-sorting protein [Porphyromonas sp.]|nr:outer membrane lipoprotein-sorting protein [Porphyromonas sp.]